VQAKRKAVTASHVWAGYLPPRRTPLQQLALGNAVARGKFGGGQASVAAACGSLSQQLTTPCCAALAAVPLSSEQPEERVRTPLRRHIRFRTAIHTEWMGLQRAGCLRHRPARGGARKGRPFGAWQYALDLSAPASNSRASHALHSRQAV